MPEKSHCHPCPSHQHSPGSRQHLCILLPYPRLPKFHPATLPIAPAGFVGSVPVPGAVQSQPVSIHGSCCVFTQPLRACEGGGHRASLGLPFPGMGAAAQEPNTSRHSQGSPAAFPIHRHILGDPQDRSSAPHCRYGTGPVAGGDVLQSPCRGSG